MLKVSKKKKTTNNKLILQLRRKRLIRKLIAMVISLCIGIGVFITKSNVFIVKKVSVVGNPIMSGEDVKANTEYLLGQNIFFIDKGKIIEEAKKNPYVEGVTVIKSYPKQVNIKITEKQGMYAVLKDEKYYVLSDEGLLLEKANNIDNRKLISIIGLNINDIDLGNNISDSYRVMKVLRIFSEIAKVNPSNFNIDSIDMTDLMNIKVYIGEVEGKIGNDENIPDKMNKLLHIVENSQIGIKKGYIDVGFDGSPIYYKEEVSR
ncbi:MAG: FtsQ-type POTRA domain-containing protein [Clostridium butyricum]|nr:FtsQ-type POTRA domain-containing protein [Clostridium butyricum]